MSPFLPALPVFFPEKPLTAKLFQVWGTPREEWGTGFYTGGLDMARIHGYITI